MFEKEIIFSPFAKFLLTKGTIFLRNTKFFFGHNLLLGLFSAREEVLYITIETMKNKL